MSKTTFIKSVFILCLMALPLGVSAQSLKGDVNDDGLLGITDVNLLIDYLLTNDSTGINLANADADDDGEVSIGDVVELIDTLLAMSSGPQDEHEWVDLGLPSGTLWATCNVGASAPEEYGDYFSWGETEPKEVYNWSTNKWFIEDHYDANGILHFGGITKYCTNSSYGYNGFTDGKTELDPEDDAASVNWGASWRMPTLEQQQELKDNCTWTWTQQNGVKGCLVTGQNGNFIFLPAAGMRGKKIYDEGLWGYYWSRSLHSDDSDDAFSLNFNSDDVGLYDSSRSGGFTVRAVRVSQN